MMAPKDIVALIINLREKGHQNQQEKSLEFAKTNLDKPQTYWNSVIFSDKSKFNVFSLDSRMYVRRKYRE